jgi:fimbrial chaperone protein
MAHCAAAQGLTISPVLLDAPPRGGAVALTISSGFEVPRTVQVRVFDWTQARGSEQLTPSRTVSFAPEIFDIAPGKSQTVRFQVPDTRGAGAWRVVVDELPALDVGQGAAVTQTTLRLRQVLPMFAAAPGNPESLTVQASHEGIRLHNPGPGWLKLHDLELSTQAGEITPAAPGIVYLLAGAETHLAPAEDASTFSALSFAAGQDTYTLSLRSGK